MTPTQKKLQEVQRDIETLQQLVAEGSATEAVRDELAECERTAAILERRVAKLERTNARSRARNAAMVSVGMVRTPYGWE